MSIPKYNELFTTFLKCLSDNSTKHINDIFEYCVKTFKLTQKDLSEKIKSGQGRFKSRVGWAKTYLLKAGLIENPKRGYFKISIEGVKALKSNKNIDLNYLNQFDSFKTFFNRNTKNNNNEVNENDSENTPIESISNALEKINFSLAEDLMTEILKLDSTAFENLVVKLLVKMGYGSEDLNKNAVTKKTGDEGIDGCIIADQFGFDSIYTQAKKWQSNETVGRPEIQKFLGALVGQGATKGLFITTSKFSKEAMTFASSQKHCKIVLIDGQKLTDLMIQHNLGVTVVATYEIKRIDSDFFNDEF